MAAQKQWDPPQFPASSSEERLQLYNSLLDEKTAFVPRGGPDSKNVLWYCCGPTVYDSAHIGHARNYVTFDIIRRVLEDHFSYNVTYVMNVTDVDDKIITRARRNHLLATFLKDGATLEKVVQLCCDAVAAIVPQQEGKVEGAQKKLDEAAGKADSRTIKDYQERLDGEKLKLSKVQADAERVQQLKAGKAANSTAEAVAKEFQDILAEYLDSLHGSTVTDINIYRAHAAKFEKQFFDDLAALNCRMPHAIPRITDHIPEIVSFIEKIMEKGFAYAAGEEGNKSVYFDTAAFRAAGHRYGKLEPWKVGSADLASEGESNFKTTEKRGPQDFVLWKASKAGEPSWESSWGAGRPGWHIECSAMIDAVCGKQIDIHSGGMDLRFPHHDNEIAQSEAHNCGSCPPAAFSEQWCNYWLHSGHLAIDGLKMSKSLKNFITIREALREFSARQLRLLFCLSAWSQPITFNQQSRAEMVQKESTLKNFFLSVQVVLRTNALEKSSTKALPEHQAIATATADCQTAVNRAFMDNIDTVSVMESILGLVSKVNSYIDRVCPASGIQPDALRVRQAAEYVTRVLRILGLSDAGPDDLGFSTRPAAASTEEAVGASTVAAVFAAFATTLRALPQLTDVPPEARAPIDAALAAAPQQQVTAVGASAGAGGTSDFSECLQGKGLDEVVDELVACRDVVRTAARDAGAAKLEIMRVCDEVRDVALVDIGIKLEDKPTGGVWMRVDAGELRKEVQEKQKAAAMTALDKVEKKLSMAREELSKAEAVLQFATTQEALATRFRFSADNTVTHESKDAEWLEVDSKRLKAINKIVEKEDKMRAPITKKVAQNADYLSDTRASIAELAQQVQKLSIAAS